MFEETPQSTDTNQPEQNVAAPAPAGVSFDFSKSVPVAAPETPAETGAAPTGVSFDFSKSMPLAAPPPEQHVRLKWLHDNFVAPLANAASRIKEAVLANEGPGWLPYDIAQHFEKKEVPPPATDAEAAARLKSRVRPGENQNPEYDQQTLDSEKREIDRARADKHIEQRNAKQYAEGGTRLISPEKLFTKEEAQDSPVLYGLAKVAGSLTSQENMLIMASTSGLGFLGEAAAQIPKLGALAKLVQAAPRMVSLYFAGNMAKGVAQQVPGLIQAKDEYDKAIAAGDKPKADQILWNIKEQTAEAAATAYLAYAAAHHGATGAPEPIASKVGEAVKDTTKFAAEKGVEAIRNIPEVAKATVEGAKSAAGYAAEKLGPMIGRTNDFETAITRASKVTPKQAEGFKEKLANVKDDLQAIANANPDVEGPKEFAEKIREHNQAEEAKMQRAAGAEKDSSESVVPDAEKRMRDRLDKFFDDNKGRFSGPDVEKAKQDVLDHFLQQDKDETLRAPNLYEAENVRSGLNDMTRPSYATNAQPTTSAFKAAAKEAANSLREMIDESYHDKGVEGVKEFRSKEANKIDIAEALEAAQDRADKMGEGTVFRSLMKKIGVPSSVIAIALGHPVSGAAIGAAVLGDQISQNLTNPNVNINRALDIAAKNPAAAATEVTENPNPAPPVNHKLYAALSSHYGKLVGAVPFEQLEERFQNDVQAAAEKGQITPEQKSMLEKINDSKADQRMKAEEKQLAEAEKAKVASEKAAADQQKAAEKKAAEEQKAAEKAAQEAEDEKKEKEELGLKTNLIAPFETESHIHPDDEFALQHEIGHHFQIAKAGHPTHDIIGRLHDQIDKGAEAEARWHPEAFLDDKGALKLDYLRDNIGSLLDIFHGGPVADEVMNGVPVHKNAGAETDLRRARTKLIEAGFTPSEAGQLMAASEARVRKDFTAPGVRDIFQRYSQAREAGIDPGLLMTPETSGRAIQEFKDALEGTNESDNEPTPAGKSGGSNKQSKSGGVSGVPRGGKSGARPASEKGEGAGGGEGRGLQVNKAGVKERSTGSAEDDAAIKKGGGVPAGTMFEGPDTIRMFHEPETGTTLGFRAHEKITPEVVKEKLSESRKRYGLKTEKAAVEEKPDVAKAADEFNRAAGRPAVNAEPIPHSPEVANRIAQAYEQMPHNPADPAVKKAYDAAKKDINDQWNYATDKMGVKFEPWTKEGQPYANSKEMMKDVKDNDHLYFFQGGELPADHPLAQTDPATGFTYNDKLRAVHDLFGHAAHEFQFGPKGEENAWNVHRQMFSPEAVPALTTETRGQNSWVNFGEHLKNAEGKIPAKGEAGYVPPAERPFAQNKAGVLPEKFHAPNAGENWSSKIDLAKQPAGGINPLNPEAPSKRYGFEILPEARRELGANPTAEDFQKYAEEHKDKFGLHPDIKLGWDTTGEKPELNIGASTDDLAKAKDMAGKLDQRALWDNEEEKVVPVGGKGEKTAFPEYPLEDRLNDLKLNKTAVAEEKYHPDLQAVIDKNELVNNLPNHASFITPDGKFVKLSHQTHPEAIKEATGEDFNDAALSDKIKNEEPGTEDNRVKFLNDTGAIRTRLRQTMAGTELVASVPKQGVTDAQVQALRKAVGKVGREGNLVIERSDASSENPLFAKKEFPRVGDVDQMLRDIEAHPDQKGAEGFEFGKNAEGSPDQQKGLISTRVPSGAKSTENPVESDLKIGREALDKVPGMDKKMADLVREYPGVNIPENVKDPKKVLNRFVDHVSENLKNLYENVPEERRAANVRWYDSASKMATKLGEKYGKTAKQAAGVIATMSPQKDWDQNVSLAERVNDIYHQQQDKTATPEMMSKANEIGARPTGKVFAEMGPKLEGKKLSDLTDIAEKAAWIRLYDEAHNPRDYQSIDPATGEGRGQAKTAAGEPQKVAWGGLNEIGKAVSILEDGSRENISNNLEDAHKVRNFYNNIVDPNNPAGHVTIDTHAVAAGLQRALSGKSSEVLHNFGAGGAPSSSINGVNGTYALYADAYRNAAKDLGIQPRQLQSVVWEEIRNMFPGEMKRVERHPAAVDKIWQDYGDRKITLDKAHELVRDYSRKAATEMAASRKSKGEKMSAQDFLSALQGSLFKGGE